MEIHDIEVEGLSHSYGKEAALCEVSFAVEPGELVALLGPNGGGKTTLLQILSTLLLPTGGTARIAGHDVRKDPSGVRSSLGVVFQFPGLDRKLTVEENLFCQARLFGLPRREAAARIDRALESGGIAAWRGDRVEKLSGGLARRADLARAFLSRPRVLLLDEPTAGLDPAARRDFWEALAAMRQESPTTVLFTTHLTQEAESAERVGLLDRGRLEAFDTPAGLKSSIGGDVVTIRGTEPEWIAEQIRSRLNQPARAVDGGVILEQSRGAEYVPQLAEILGGRVQSISVARPTLEDVFLRLTGRSIDPPEGSS